MDVSDDLPPPRRPLFFPVVIATVLLTIIGMSAGLALASRDGSPRANEPGRGATPATSAAVAAGTPTPSGDQCRTETQLMAQRSGTAQGPVVLRLELRTRTSTVYICADQAGNLFYHANRGGPDARWVEGETALFLDGVRSDGAGGYTATAVDGTTFSITRQRLLIVHKDGRQERQPAL